jgi:hypothetical protein
MPVSKEGSLDRGSADAPTEATSASLARGWHPTTAAQRQVVGDCGDGSHLALGRRARDPRRLGWAEEPRAPNARSSPLSPACDSSSETAATSVSPLPLPPRAALSRLAGRVAASRPARKRRLVGADGCQTTPLSLAHTKRRSRSKVRTRGCGERSPLATRTAPMRRPPRGRPCG